MEYLGLFAGAFLAATLVPFSSELALFALLAAGAEPAGLWFAATAGNTAGSVVNWAMGRYLLHFQDRAWFPVKRQQMEAYQHWFSRFGVWSLLFAWLPAGGDALTFIAGIMRVRLPLFVVLVGLGKGLRYLVIVAAASSLG